MTAISHFHFVTQRHTVQRTFYLREACASATSRQSLCGIRCLAPSLIQTFRMSADTTDTRATGQAYRKADAYLSS